MTTNPIPPTEASSSSKLQSAELIALICFVLSGFAALVYEISWIRKASLVVGATSYAVSTVLGVFFGGLAIGSYLFGKRTRQQRTPIRLYGKLEIGVGILCIASVFTLPLVESLYSSLYDSIQGGLFVALLIRAALVSICLLPPTILMGATLPLFCRQFIRHKNGVLNSISWLYGLNTLGAAVGAAVCGFALLPAIGVNASIFLAGGISIVVGGIMLVVKLPDTAAHVEEEQTPEKSEQSRDKSRTMGIVFALSGFAAIGNEVIWTRFLTLILENNVYTYTLTLTVILLGIVLGSLLASMLTNDLRKSIFRFGVLQIVTGIVTFAIIMAPAEIVWISFMENIGTSNISQQLMLIGLIMLIPSILAGMAFPIGIRLATSGVTSAGAIVGRLSALNTFGGIIGSFVIGFLVLPKIGLENAISLTAVCNVLAGFLVWMKLDESKILQKRVGWILLVAVMFVGIRLTSNSFIVERTRVPFDMLRMGRTIPTLDENNLAMVEGVNSFLTVVENGDIFELYIDKQWQGNSQRTQQFMAGHIPSIVHGNPKNVCVVGLGTGQTAKRFLMHEIEQLDLVEIEEGLEPLLIRFFNGGWLAEDSVERQITNINLITEDGRNYLAHASAKYDIISIEVGQVFRPGIANFYTHEFYQQTRERLNDGGVISQFVPLEFLGLNEFRNVVRTFVQTYPNAQLWYNTSELLLLGINRDVNQAQVFTKDSISNALHRNETVIKDLTYNHWGGKQHQLNNPTVFLSGFLANGQDLRAMCADGQLLVDDKPSLEYSSHPYLDFHRPVLNQIRDHVSPVDNIIDDIGPALSARCHVLRNHNLAQIEAVAYTDTAKALFNIGHYNDAMAFMKHAIIIQPDYATAHFDLANMLQNILQIQAEEGIIDNQATVQRYSEDSKALLFKTTLINNNHWEAHKTLANINFYRDHDILNAIDHLENVIRVTVNPPLGEDYLSSHPDDVESMLFLATFLAMSPDPNVQDARRAEEIVTSALNHEIDALQATQLKSTLAAARAMQGDFKDARNILVDAISTLDDYVNQLAVYQNRNPDEVKQAYADFRTELDLRYQRYLANKLYLNSSMVTAQALPQNNAPLDLNNLNIPGILGVPSDTNPGGTLGQPVVPAGTETPKSNNPGLILPKTNDSPNQ
ncbi:MAG: fused MFS/spermidine synthase [Planctomycetaceae bacterium]|jgi:spermidine synthase|nr:fused MFS/spermidine synthase [Planctomycetaceae bacterium]